MGEAHLRVEPVSDIELPVLEALADEPSLSQRELAQRVGLSLTRAHFVLKRLMERGLVKVRNAAVTRPVDRIRFISPGQRPPAAARSRILQCGSAVPSGRPTTRSPKPRASMVSRAAKSITTIVAGS